MLPNQLDEIDGTEDGLVPPFEPEIEPGWPGARWIGSIAVDDPRLNSRDQVALRNADGFRAARLLVRRGESPCGFVEVPVHDGVIDSQVLAAQIAALPEPGISNPISDDKLPVLTVALCTRDRAGQLKTALPSLLSLSYPNLKILVIDNASRTDEVLHYVEALGDNRVRAVYEPRAGLSAARNRALIEADTDWIAFTDDDVVVDPGWLRGIAIGIMHSPNTALVCGTVATGELVSRTQQYFERRIEWAGALKSATFDLAAPPADVPLFPFEVGMYGTGANFAVDRRHAIALGGFNEALGAGTPTGGGEDIDMFVRVIVSGRTLVREASAVVWHRHRVDSAGLTVQMRSYGTGMTAWIVSAFLAKDTRALAIRRLGRAARRLRRVGNLAEAGPSENGPEDALFGTLQRTEVRGMLWGPVTYARSCLAGRATRPLRDARLAAVNDSSAGSP